MRFTSTNLLGEDLTLKVSTWWNEPPGWRHLHDRAADYMHSSLEILSSANLQILFSEADVRPQQSPTIRGSCSDDSLAM